MVSQYSQRQCRSFALLLLALVFAWPGHARDIADTPGALFFTADETAGIQMVKPETALFDSLGNPIPGSSCCDQPFFGGELPIGPSGETDVNRLWLQADDFEASSLAQFQNLGAELGREAARTRLRPFLGSWVYDTNEDTLAIADRSLGPMLAERPHTLGQGRIALGWSYRQLYWTRLNGQKLDSLQFHIDHKFVYSAPKDDVYLGVPNPTPGQPHPLRVQAGDRQGQETDFITVDMNLKLEQDFVDFYFEYGVTNNIDVSIVLPLVQTKLKIRAFAKPIEQPDPASGANITEPGLDFAYRFDSGANKPAVDPLNPDQWQTYHSRRNHQFCRSVTGQVSNVTQTSLLRISKGVRCPGGNVASQKGDQAQTTFGGIIELKEAQAIGIGDIRFRAKWHALEGDGLIPDLAWVSEVRPPSGKEEDLQGSGALSTSNFLVGSWAVGPLRPHMNVGVEISTGPDWQDATEWVFGVEWLMFDWLSLSIEQMGRVPFGKAVSRRYEYGGGIKLIPTPGAALYFDFIRPINQDDGLTADLSWRAGGQILF
jgi:hypothetical protein